MNAGEGTLQVAIGGVTAPRIAAAEICADLRGGEMLDSSFERRTADLDARDRRWLRELVYGMLRQRGTIDAILEERVRGGLSRVDADLVDLMRLGVYQLMHMGSVPAYAAIAQTVELAKFRHGIGASKLMNAVLSRIDRESGELSVRPAEDRVEAKARPDSARQEAKAQVQAREGLGEAVQAAPPELERFRTTARSALSEADTLLAARALAQWRDSLAPREDLSPELERAARALADSLAAFLANRP